MISSLSFKAVGKAIIMVPKSTVADNEIETIRMYLSLKRGEGASKDGTKGGSSSLDQSQLNAFARWALAFALPATTTAVFCCWRLLRLKEVHEHSHFWIVVPHCSILLPCSILKQYLLSIKSKSIRLFWHGRA